MAPYRCGFLWRESRFPKSRPRPATRRPPPAPPDPRRPSDRPPHPSPKTTGIISFSRSTRSSGLQK